MDKHFRSAVQNIARLGDTDVLPFPIENHIFFDKEDQVVDLLSKIDRGFDDYLFKDPPLNESVLAPAGYVGFRSVTQIDPIWNAYLLGLVLSVGDEIEAARVPPARNTVFSYRYEFDDSSKAVFNPNVGWHEFQAESVRRAKQNSFVLTCDISDFYPRIYHHRLENALMIATKNNSAVPRIMKLLNAVSKNVSYGLPVGGPAARLLSELLLNRVDRLLLVQGISFCRFVDDYHIFAPTREKAYSNLVFLSEKLLENEGLALHKAKTRIMTSEEFLSVSQTIRSEDSNSAEETQVKGFLSLSLRYDPYSSTADEDYESLRGELQRFNVVGMLTAEIEKSRVHQALTRKLISAVKFLEPDVKADAVRSLIDNAPLLYPVFPNVMLLFKSLLNDMDGDTKQYIFQGVRNLLTDESFITRVPANLGYAIRVIADDESEEAELLLAKIYNETPALFIKRDIILIMAKRNAHFWISDLRRAYNRLTDWERRALIVASFILADEGMHWRRNIRRELSDIDKLYQDWTQDKSLISGWSIPI